jgi:alkylated DNA nucleotide flippase Atl1
MVLDYGWGMGSDRTSTRREWKLATAALAALPPGTWTTFGDIAEIERTSAQGVASWISSTNPPKNGYRVLSSDGRVPEGFKWNAANADETRHPVNVLGFDGVPIGVDGLRGAEAAALCL